MFVNIILFLSFVSITRDQVFTNRKVVHIYTEFERSQKYFSKAERRLRDHLQSDATDAQAWELLGRILEDENKIALAEESYGAAIRVSPKNLAGRSHYILADFYSRHGRSADAKKELEAALRDWRARPAAKSALNALNAGNSLAPYFEEPDFERFSGNLGMAAGYDSNVLFLSDTTLDSVSISNTQSPSFLLFGGFRYENQFLNGKFDGKAFSSASLYSAGDAMSFSSLTERMGFDWKWDFGSKTELGFGSTVDANFLNTDSFEYFNSSYRFFPELIWKIAPFWKLKFDTQVSYLHFNQEDPGAGNERSGYSVNPEVVQEFYWESSTLSLGAGYEKIWAEGENFNLDSYQVPVTWTFKLPYQLVSALSFKWTLNNYGDSSDSRTDHTIQPSIMIGRVFKEKLSTYVQYGFSRNISSTDSAQYLKHTASILVNYAFK